MTAFVDDLDLPVTKALNRELISQFIEENGSLDIDKLLLDNNFQYVSLDELAHEVSMLKQSMDESLLDEIKDIYPEYMQVCERFDAQEGNEVSDKLRQVLGDLDQFKKQLDQLCQTTVPDVTEKTVSIVTYLKSLDKLLDKLDDVSKLSESLHVCQQLLDSLQSMIQLEIDGEIPLTVAKQLSAILIHCDYRLRHLEGNESPLVTRMRNEFKSIIEASSPLVKPILKKNLGRT